MQIYIANIEAIRKNPDLYIGYLPPRQKSRASKFQNHTRKLQYILGHLVVNSCNKKHTSIAHKDNFVVVAMASDAPVGIDIENATIQRDFVSASEIMGIDTPKSLNDFYKKFTQIEASYKLGVKPRCTRHMRYGDYLICMTSSHRFEMPRLRKFDIESICTPE